MTCPRCKKDFDLANASLEYERLGRRTVCPHCTALLHLTRYVEPVRTRPKRLSKKERLRLRRASREIGA